MIKAFWLVYELIMLGGAVAYGLLIFKYFQLWQDGKKNIADRVRKLTDKGTDRQTAIKYVRVKKNAAITKFYAYIAIVFVFVYVAIDIVFTHIL